MKTTRNWMKGLVLAAVCALVVLSLSDSALAATITVSNNGDAGAAGDALIAAVHNASPGDEIVLSPGDYNLRSSLDITTNVTISGPATAPGAIIRGGSLAGASKISDREDLVAIAPGVTVTLRDVALTGTGSDGAALNVFGTVDLQDSLVGSNAGLGVSAEPESSVGIVDSTIAANAYGLLSAGSAHVSLASVTLAANRLGGIFNQSGGRVDLTDSIVAGNGKATGARVGDCQLKPGTDDAPGSAASTIDGDGTCGAPIHGGQGLAGLADNGGPTLTMKLNAGSAAIDAGGSGCPAKDQRGAPRVGGCDIGAFEYGSTAPASSAGGSGGGSASGGSPATANAGASAPTAKTTAAHAAKLTGVGVILVRGERVGFRLRVNAQQPTGLVVVTDAARGVRLRATRLTAALFDVSGQRVTLRGSAVLSRRRVTFAVRVFGRERGRLEIRLSNGYVGSGTVVRGSLSITG